MEIGVLLTIVVLVGLIGFMVWRKFERDSRQFNALYQPTDGDLPDGDDSFGEVIAFEGDDTFKTAIFPLVGGQYKLSYWFPDEVLVKVELFSADGTDHEVIILTKGEGEKAFTVSSSGRYFCTIEPVTRDEWEIEISRLGLPSKNGISK